MDKEQRRKIMAMVGNDNFVGYVISNNRNNGATSS